MNLNLLLAIFWVVVAGVFFMLVPPAVGGADWSVLWTRPSPGWLAIVLGIYNLVRWWVWRATVKRRGAEAGEPKLRRRA
jgi:hypothetical protein